MRIRPILLALLPLFWGFLSAQTSPFPPIPIEVWEEKEKPLSLKEGAVILKDKYHFQRRALLRQRRILVVSAAGREATSHFQFKQVMPENLQGRVVFPDGRQVAFQKGKDLIKRNILRSVKGDEETWDVVPPSLENHCLIDLQWEESIQDDKRPIPDGYGLRLVLVLKQDIPVRSAQVRLDRDIHDLGWKYNFETARGQAFRQTDLDGVHEFYFENIPARQPTPFVSTAESERPQFIWYWVPDMDNWLRSIYPQGWPSMSFFSAAAKTVAHYLFLEQTPSPSRLTSWCYSLGKGAPTDRIPLAHELIRRLQNAVTPLDLVRDSYGVLDRKVLAYERWDLATKQGFGSPGQLRFLAFHLLKNHGLDPKIVYVVDREENFFRVDSKDFWQFDSVLLQVSDWKGNTTFLNPGNPWKPFGVPAWNRGTRAVAIVMGAKQTEWDASIVSLPNSVASENEERISVDVDPREDETHYSGSWILNGDASASMKALIRHGAQDSAARTAKILENRGFTPSSASIQLSNPNDSTLSIRFNGARESQPGKGRSFLPFPFYRSFMTSQTNWPEHRTEPILLPFPTAISLVAKVLVPQGSPEPKREELMKESNRIGRVSLVLSPAEQNGKRYLQVEATIHIEADTAPAHAYQDLKAFKSWVENLFQRTIPIP